MAYRISNAYNMYDLMIDLVDNVLRKTPAKEKHPLFDNVLPDHEAVDELYGHATGVHYAPGLFEVLTTTKAPPNDFFESTPAASTFKKKKFSVYNVVMKFGLQTEHYFGEAACSDTGHRGRMSNYNTGHNMPHRVALRVSQGWTISHVGFIAWMDLPTFAYIPRLRLLTLAIEATMTYAFWGLAWDKTKSHGGKADFCLFDRLELDYAGLCTHPSIYEAVHSAFGLSDEEVIALQSEMALRRKEAVPKSRNKAKLERPEEYKAMMSRQRAEFIVLNPEKVKAIDKKHKVKANAEAKRLRKFDCKPCGGNFPQIKTLARHLVTKTHIQTVGPEAAHRCADCGYEYPDEPAMTMQIVRTHLYTPMHKAAKAAQVIAREVNSGKQSDVVQVDPDLESDTELTDYSEIDLDDLSFKPVAKSSSASILEPAVLKSSSISTSTVKSTVVKSSSISTVKSSSTSTVKSGSTSVAKSSSSASTVKSVNKKTVTLTHFFKKIKRESDSQ